MIDVDLFSQVKSVLQSSASTLILLKSTPTVDQVASALALLNVLQSHKKEAFIACSQPMRVEFGNLVGVDQVQTEIGNRSLQVSFAYDEHTVENVSYNIDQEQQKFFLVIRPQKGHRALDPNTIEYSHTGLDADAIVMVGITNYAEIDEYYQTEEQAFTQAHTIAIARSETNFAEYNLGDSGYASVAELMFELIKQLELESNSDAATNLLAGIEHATDTFRHYAVTAETFERVAQLMRQGARRIRTGGAEQPSAATTNLAQAFAKTSTPVPVAASPQVASNPQVGEIPQQGIDPSSLQIPQLRRVNMPISNGQNLG